MTQISDLSHGAWSHAPKIDGTAPAASVAETRPRRSPDEAVAVMSICHGGTRDQWCEDAIGDWGTCREDGKCSRKYYNRVYFGDCPRGKWPPIAKPDQLTFVYPYLASAAVGNELLYSVRSVEANFLGEADIWIVGDRPPWWKRTDRFLECPRIKGGARIDRANKLMAICRHPAIPDRFVWMQDDVYFIKPVDIGFLSTPWSRGPAMTPDRLKTHRPSGGFGRQKLMTWKVLHANGRPMEDRAAHVPCVYEKEKLRELFSKFDLLKTQYVDDLLYLNYFADTSQPVIQIGKRMARIHGSPTSKQLEDKLAPAYLHNHAHGSYKGAVEKNLDATFNNHSRWETAAVKLKTISNVQAANTTIRPMGHDRLPKIAVCCATYGRPHLISTMVGCFARQDYPADRCEMIVLDDGGQLVPGEYRFNGKEVRVYSQPDRFSSIGEKRNAMRQLVSSDAEAITQWDDDDVMLPWALKAMADRLQEVGIALCSWAHWQEKDGSIHTVRKVLHCACAFRLETFDAVGGYPAQNKGEDMQLLSWFVDKRGHGKFPPERNTIDKFHPYLLVRRFLPGTYHVTQPKFDYDEHALKQTGEKDVQVVVEAALLPKDIETWYGSIRRSGGAGQKLSKTGLASRIPTANVAEWHLTYSCDLSCTNCNRLCFVRPATNPMTIADAEEFCRQARAMSWRPTILILGGEPCLHPEFFRFLEIAQSLSPGNVNVWSNGHSERTKTILEKVRLNKLATIVEGTQKKSGSVVHKLNDMFLAPSDFGATREPCRAHSCFGECGISVDHEGYSVCCSGGAIDGVLGLGLRTKCLADLWDHEFAAKQTMGLCSKCGLYLGIDSEKIAASTVAHGSLMSPTWARAVEQLGRRGVRGGPFHEVDRQAAGTERFELAKDHIIKPVD